jgi:hypothetical protein
MEFFFDFGLVLVWFWSRFRSWLWIRSEGSGGNWSWVLVLVLVGLALSCIRFASWRLSWIWIWSRWFVCIRCVDSESTPKRSRLKWSTNQISLHCILNLDGDPSLSCSISHHHGRKDVHTTKVPNRQRSCTNGFPSLSVA